MSRLSAIRILSGAAVLAAAAFFLAPVTDEARRARGEDLRTATARALEADALRLLAVARSVESAPEFSEIVDGGGSALRPARLFTLLTKSLPNGSGWGAVFFDASGRAVGWAGEAGDLEAERTADTAGTSVTFHVTRFSMAYRSPRRFGAERRGVLVVSRRYPTGILRPDLVDALGIGRGPSMVRIRARAATQPGRLVALFVEAASDENADADVRRCRARIPAELAAVLCVVAAFVDGPLWLILARGVLLLGAPRAEMGVWNPLGESGSLLSMPFATPADLFLTGLFALVLARGLLGRPPRRRPPVPLAAVLALGAAAVPIALGLGVGSVRSSLFDDLSLVPESVPAFLARTGVVLLSLVALTLASWFLAGVARPRASVAGPLGFALGLAALWRTDEMLLVLAAVGTLLVALALADRVSTHASRDLLGRVATIVFLALGSGVAASAGLRLGLVRRLDTALSEAREETEPRDAAAAARWSSRVARVPGPWLPAGARTLSSDLARALWVRGAGESFPQGGDVLTIRDGSGDEISSFGVIRPGAESRGHPAPARIPVPALSATFTRVPYPPESDRDALLSAIVSIDLPERVPIERYQFDAAGRPTGASGDERTEISGHLLREVRKRGEVLGDLEMAAGSRRIRLTGVDGGFVGLATPSAPALITLGSTYAAGELVLPLLVLLLVPGGQKRPGARLPRRHFFRTFRARLVLLVFLFGALPIAGSVGIVRLALERQSAGETVRRAQSLLDEARRALLALETIRPSDLNRVASFLGNDLYLYRDGRLIFASRALPVTAGLAGDRLTAPVAEALADGRSAAAVARAPRRGGLRAVEAAEPISRDGRDALAVVVAEDEAGRLAVDGLVLFAIAVALGAFGMGGRAALGLGKPLADLIEGAERLGSGEPAAPIERPQTVDLARLVDAFQTMSERVHERTESLARERAAAVGLLSNLTAAVILFRESDGTVLLANPAADLVLPGSDLGTRIAPVRWAPLRAALAAAKRKPTPHETRVGVTVEGADRVFRVVVAPLPPDGSEARSLLLLEDLTDFIRADRLTAWVDAARAIAHDIKNPLTPIRLAAERLIRVESKREPPAGFLSETGANILRQVAILTERIGRLARFSDPATLERVRLDRSGIARLLGEVASDYAAEESVAIRVRVAEEVPSVSVDPSVIRDALTNFVVNALEAFGDRGGTITLAAGPFPLPDGRPGMRVVCEDDGPGVPEEARSRLFDPRFSTKSRGSGMGLAAARRAVERHGGSVFGEERVGGGLAIGFTLPADAG